VVLRADAPTALFNPAEVHPRSAASQSPSFDPRNNAALRCQAPKAINPSINSNITVAYEL
jgi:hypothetical protein